MVRRLREASGTVAAARDAATADEAGLASAKLAEAIMDRSGELIRRSYIDE
jgi:hypothetical protein